MIIREVLTMLKMVDPENEVMFSFGGCVPTKVASWRGCFAEPALGWAAPQEDGKNPTVGGLIAELEGALKKTYDGWKGGEFAYTLDDPLHVDNPGRWTETEIFRVELFSYTGVILHTHREET